MNTCKDCRHWDRQLGKRGVCRLISGERDMDKLEDLSRPAYVMKWNNGAECLITHEVFGCTLFESREMA